MPTYMVNPDGTLRRAPVDFKVMQKPSKGRIVIAYTAGDGEFPAIITTVHSDEMVNIRGLGETHGQSDVKTSIRLHGERPENPTYDAWWPPRV